MPSSPVFTTSSTTSLPSAGPLANIVMPAAINTKFDNVAAPVQGQAPKIGAMRDVTKDIKSATVSLKSVDTSLKTLTQQGEKQKAAQPTSSGAFSRAATGLAISTVVPAAAPFVAAAEASYLAMSFLSGSTRGQRKAPTNEKRRDIMATSVGYSAPVEGTMGAMAKRAADPNNRIFAKADRDAFDRAINKGPKFTNSSTRPEVGNITDRAAQSSAWLGGVTTLKVRAELEGTRRALISSIDGLKDVQTALKMQNRAGFAIQNGDGGINPVVAAMASNRPGMKFNGGIARPAMS